MMDKFIELLHKIWNSIKKFFVKLLNFVKNIANFFKNPSRLSKLKQDSNIIATSIKENLSNGDYNVVNCLYDKETEQVVEMEENAEGINAEAIDLRTQQSFGDKTMIILQ